MEEELRDDQWALIEPLLPAQKRRGRPRADDRRTLNNGILWVLRSGARWKDLPCQYGSRSTCHRRLQEWQEQEIWEHIWLTFLGTLDQLGKLDWNQRSRMVALSPLKRVRGYSLWLEGQGQHGPSADRRQWLPLAYLVTAANASAVTVGLKVMDRVPVTWRKASLSSASSVGLPWTTCRSERLGISSAQPLMPVLIGG